MLGHWPAPPAGSKGVAPAGGESPQDRLEGDFPMKRLFLAVVLLALTVSSGWAAPPQSGPTNPPAGTVVPPRHHARWRYSSYGVWVRTMGPGYPAYRYTYSGQKDNFPMPAIFQSGSEHTNYTYGMGF
jgi:hypothetical protein